MTEKLFTRTLNHNQNKTKNKIIQQFFRRARADNSGVGVGIWPKFELIQAFMHVLVTCKNKDG